MKRSEINRYIDWAVSVCKKLHIALPSFAFWTPEEWKRRGTTASHMLAVKQGWDVTDYNSGNFNAVGAVLFTLRNGNIDDKKEGTPYCEKVIIMKEGQKLPLHFHYSKTEDIINRGGGVLCVRVYNSTSEQDGFQLDYESKVHLRLDGLPVLLPAGGVIEVANGNSITLTPYIYHEFWAKEGEGDLVIGEVSSINDDTRDNHFIGDMNLPKIEEDEPIRYPLCNGYVQK